MSLAPRVHQAPTSSTCCAASGPSTGSTLVGLAPAGSLQARPRAPRRRGSWTSAALRVGETVAGNVGHVVFVAQPLNLSPAQRQRPRRRLAPLGRARPRGHASRGQPGERRRLLHPRGRGRAPRRGRRGRRAGPAHQRAHRAGRGRHAPDRGGQPRRHRARWTGASPPSWPSWPRPSTPWARTSAAPGASSASSCCRSPTSCARRSRRSAATPMPSRTAPPTTFPGAVTIIGSEARRLERLVQDLLDLARLQARQFSLHTQPVDCAAVARTVAEGFQPEADAARSRARHGRAPATARVGRRRSRPRGAGRRQPDRERTQVRHHPGRGRHPARGRVGRGVGLRRRPRASAPPISPTSSSATTARTVSQAASWGSGLGLAIVAELASAMGGRGRRPVPGRRRAGCPHGAVAAAPRRRPSGDEDRTDESMRIVDANAGAPPTPPCVGGAPSASAPVAALRLPTVEPQPGRSPGLRIGRLRAGRLGPHAVGRPSGLASTASRHGGGGGHGRRRQAQHPSQQAAGPLDQGQDH